MRHAWLIGAGALVASCMAAAGAQAQATTPQQRGRERYEALCASCHGPDGAGGGPAASALRTPPPDLRQIAARNGGFNRSAIAAIIDGRTKMGAHGSEDMPIWGWKGLRARKGDKGPSPAMLDLLAFLESIQAKP